LLVSVEEAIPRLLVLWRAKRKRRQGRKKDKGANHHHEGEERKRKKGPVFLKGLLREMPWGFKLYSRVMGASGSLTNCM
jgi:hypothetical protein